MRKRDKLINTCYVRKDRIENKYICSNTRVVSIKGKVRKNHGWEMISTRSCKKTWSKKESMQMLRIASIYTIEEKAYLEGRWTGNFLEKQRMWKTER